jgi:hypothetical protein
VEGDGQERAFRNAYHALKRRIDLLLALPLETTDRMTLANRLNEIGNAETPVE